MRCQDPKSTQHGLSYVIIYGPASSRRSTCLTCVTCLTCLCRRVPHRSKEVGLVMVPFWMRLWTEGSNGVWTAPGLIKNTQDCVQLESIYHGQKEKYLPFLSQFQHPAVSSYPLSWSDTFSSSENRDRGKMTLLRSCTRFLVTVTRSPESCHAAGPYPFKGHSSLQTSEVLVSILSAKKPGHHVLKRDCQTDSWMWLWVSRQDTYIEEVHHLPAAGRLVPSHFIQFRLVVPADFNHLRFFAISQFPTL